MSRLGARATWILQPQKVTGAADALGVPSEAFADEGTPIRCMVIPMETYQAEVAGREKTVRGVRILTEAPTELDARHRLVGESGGQTRVFYVAGSKRPDPAAPLWVIRAIEVLP